MKKLFTIVLCFTLCFAMMSEPILATSSMSTAKDPNTVELERVLSDGKLISSDTKVIITEDNEEKLYRVNRYSITEMIDNPVYSPTKGMTTSGVQTIYEVWSEVNDNTRGSGYEDAYDQTLSIYFTMTVNFTDIVENGRTYRRMTSVSGTHSVIDTQMAVSSHRIRVGQCGGRYPTNVGFDHTETYPLPIPGYSWSRTISSSVFPYVFMHSDGIMAVTYEYTIVRKPTGSTWSGDFEVSVGYI